ncbi:PIG-L deacetylase family protein [Streptodolium elevatio]|uniref:PIG-L family deacetylase n=1 Tax=Streptodolium elevatio TaxID=3157996 RepID=A0ABV3DJQ9_9ACTN
MAADRAEGIVVVAAHPDDEVLGVGGTIAGALANGRRVRVVLLTDGGASHPDGPVSPDRLAVLRARETEEALADLANDRPATWDPVGPDQAASGAAMAGPAAPGPETSKMSADRPATEGPSIESFERLGAASAVVDVVRLGLPDTAVAAHEAAACTALVPLLAGFELCLAPWSHDLHADHEAAGRLAARACHQAGTRHAQYPVWMWHWGRPGDSRVPWSRAVRVDLAPHTLVRKEQAIGRFATQIAALAPGEDDRVILPPEELAHFTRPFEVLFRC